MAGQDGKWQKEGSDQNFDYMFKLLIIGNSSVGKTSFLFRYADDSFTSAFVSTVGIDFKVKTVFRHDKRVKLQIWVSVTDCSMSPVCMYYYNIMYTCVHLRVCHCVVCRRIILNAVRYICAGHGGPGAVQDHHNGVLPGCHGVHTHVRHHQRGVVQ